MDRADCDFEYLRWPGKYPHVYRAYVCESRHPNGKTYWAAPRYKEQRRRSLPPPLREVLAWCDDQFGRPSGNRWTYVYPGGTIRFRNEADAFIFKMRFC